MIVSRPGAVEHALENAATGRRAVESDSLGLVSRLFHHQRDAVVLGRGQTLVGKSHPQPHRFALDVLAAFGQERGRAAGVGQP